MKIFKFAVPALLASAVSASAVTVDFTSNDLVATATGFSGTAGGIAFTLDGSPTTAVKGDPIDPTSIPDLTDAGLDGDFDGIGIRDDEVGDAEFLTLTFDRKVRITSAFFLDLFVAQDDLTRETANITSLRGGFDDFDAYNMFPTNGGFGGFATSIVGRVFTIFESSGNDDIGRGDVALAGLEILEVPPVPLPAGILLMGTALGGLGLARRRRKAA